jgi:hypothetical protein
MVLDAVSFRSSLVAFVLSVDMVRSMDMGLSDQLARSWRMMLSATVAKSDIVHPLLDPVG